jgi:alpha-N-arabinofuranosidase
VFLGCRPYPPVEEGYYNTGRETFLAPVQWNDGWPVINPGYDEVQYYYNDPIPSTEGAEKSRYSGNLTLRDEFDKEILDKNWIFLRTPKEQWYDLKEKPGFLNLNLRPETASGMSNPSFLGHRQQHLIGSASTALRFEPRGENEKAGLLIFQNEQHHYFLCKSIDKGKAAVQLYRSLPGTTSAKKIDLVHSLAIEENERTKDLLLKIEFDGSRYAFFYAFDPQEWKVLKDSLDGRFLSTRIAGGFVGAIFALYATSSGLPSKNTASFDWFEYKGNDAIYRQKDPGH